MFSLSLCRENSLSFFKATEEDVDVDDVLGEDTEVMGLLVFHLVVFHILTQMTFAPC